MPFPEIKKSIAITPTGANTASIIDGVPEQRRASNRYQIGGIEVSTAKFDCGVATPSNGAHQDSSEDDRRAT